MTEKEAKSKWCPMTRFHVVENSPPIVYSNRDEDNLSARCIASDCMMWRWHIRGANVDGVYNDDYPVEGHCGLGGKE